MLLAFSLLLVVVAAVVVTKLIQKNNALTNEVNDLRWKVVDLETPKPFGLVALEVVGRAMGGLTAAIVNCAYVVAAACGRPNTVAEDLATETAETLVEAGETREEIEGLKARIAAEETALEVITARTAELSAIKAQLPPAPAK